MNRNDIIEMYKKGYSVDYIVKEYYNFKTKHDIKNHSFNNVFIITKKSISMEKAREDIQKTIVDYLKTNCTK